MSAPSAQGSSVSFNGVPLGLLRSWRRRPGSAVIREKTGVNSPVIGTGADARIVIRQECVAIKPGQVNVSFYGTAPWDDTDIGTKATLSLVCATGTYSREAILEDFDDLGEVGNRIVGTAVFTLTGDDWS